MNAIVPFSFESSPVRVVNRDGQPWFVAADVCASLDIANHRDALGRLDPDERASVVVDTPGGMQSVAAINESGVYKLALRSRKAAAKRFTKWLTSDVLPSIRRTGRYGAPAAPIDLTDRTQLQALLHQLTTIALDADTKVAALEPQADALARLAQSDGSLCVTDAAKALGVPPRRLFSWLEANHWTYRRGDGGHWVAYQAKIDTGVLEHKGTTIRRHGGVPDKLVEQVMVTPKGLTRLATLKAGQ
ncbi:phage antirepressor [Novosphingobium naphthalenivorans]|uniref:phage antirepressor n=1 Tax=Novosphingobium naphthalenivorans TaxID=273168 RepID=UPI000831EE9D|nr:phage antirepressor [Novosphingobium naphthalenivorans]